MLSATVDGEEYEGFDGDGKPADFSALWFKHGNQSLHPRAFCD
jgi:hypothetical protein